MKHLIFGRTMSTNVRDKHRPSDRKVFYITDPSAVFDSSDVGCL